MNQSVPPTAPARWDWMVLTLIGVSTIGLLSAVTEWTARRLFSSESRVALQNCVVIDDPQTGGRGIPNSICREKSPESPMVVYEFNGCGHRAGIPCGPKPEGTLRIVMTGSSFAMGARVQREKSFAALLPEELSRTCGRPVQLYNESLEWSYTHGTALRFKEVLAAGPDLILWIVTPGDVERAPVVVATVAPDPGPDRGLSLSAKAWQRAKAALATKSVGVALSEVFGRTRTALLLRHYVYRYESPSRYLESFLQGGDEVVGEYKAELSSHWQDLMRQVDSDAADMEARARAAGVPFVATMLPSEPQAFMIAAGRWPPGYDPYKLSADLRAIVEGYGGTYVDILPELRDLKDPAQYFFPVDGHLNDAGHALLAALLAKQLTAGAVPLLKAAGGARSAAARGI